MTDAKDNSQSALTLPQLRAARALLGWTQHDLAKATHLSPVALSRLEGANTKPRGQTLARIRMAFEKAGVEFLAGSGVRLSGEHVAVRMLEGVDCFAEYLEDVFLTRLQYKNQDTLLHGVDEQKFLRAGGPRMGEYVAKLAEHKLKERILLRAGDRFFIAPTASVTYRWISPEAYSLVPHVIYGNKVATIFWGPPRRILIVENQQLAQTHRKQFEALWREAKPVPFTAKEIAEIVVENVK